MVDAVSISSCNSLLPAGVNARPRNVSASISNSMRRVRSHPGLIDSQTGCQLSSAYRWISDSNSPPTPMMTRRVELVGSSSHSSNQEMKSNCGNIATLTKFCKVYNITMGASRHEQVYRCMCCFISVLCETIVANAQLQQKSHAPSDSQHKPTARSHRASQHSTLASMCTCWQNPPAHGIQCLPSSTWAS